MLKIWKVKVQSIFGVITTHWFKNDMVISSFSRNVSAYIRISSAINGKEKVLKFLTRFWKLKKKSHYAFWPNESLVYAYKFVVILYFFNIYVGLIHYYYFKKCAKLYVPNRQYLKTKILSRINIYVYIYVYIYILYLSYIYLIFYIHRYIYIYT